MYRCGVPKFSVGDRALPVLLHTDGILAPLAPLPPFPALLLQTVAELRHFAVTVELSLAPLVVVVPGRRAGDSPCSVRDVFGVRWSLRRRVVSSSFWRVRTFPSALKARAASSGCVPCLR